MKLVVVGTLPEELRERIRRERIKLGWTQRELGRRAGLSQSAVSTLERGLTYRGKVAPISRIMKLLGIPFSFRALGIPDDDLPEV